MSAIKKIFIAALIITLVIAPAALCAARYSTKTVQTDDFVIKTSSSASIYYLTTGAAVMTDDNATLLTMDVKNGDYVTKGQQVASYSVETSAADIVKAQNALNEAKDDYEYALKSNQALIDSYKEAADNASDEDDKRYYELLIERAEIENASGIAEMEANIAYLETALENAEHASDIRYVYAPMDGIIDSVATEGIAIARGKPVITLYDPESVLIVVRDDGSLKYGMEVEVKLSGRSIQANGKGKVIAADNVCPVSEKNGYAVIECEEALRGGFWSAQVNAETLRVKDAMIVSSDTLTYNNGASFVQVYDNDERVRVRYVAKSFDNGSDTWILSGIQPGDKLIIK